MLRYYRKAIWRCLAGAPACDPIPGWLSAIVAGDLNGDGRADIAGIGLGNTIWAMLDGVTWQWVPGWVAQLVAGDFYGDGHAHLAGIGLGNTLWRSPALGAWEGIPGWASTLVSGDFDGDGFPDLAVIGGGQTLWIFRNRQFWEPLPGWLLTMSSIQGTTHQDLLGWNGQCWWRMPQVGAWQLHACDTQVAVP